MYGEVDVDEELYNLSQFETMNESPTWISIRPLYPALEDIHHTTRAAIKQFAGRLQKDGGYSLELQALYAANDRLKLLSWALRTLPRDKSQVSTSYGRAMRFYAALSNEQRSFLDTGAALTYSQLNGFQRARAWSAIAGADSKRYAEEHLGNRTALHDMMGELIPLVGQDVTDELPYGLMPAGRVFAHTFRDRIIYLLDPKNLHRPWGAIDLDLPPPAPIEGPLESLDEARLDSMTIREGTQERLTLRMELSRGHFFDYSFFGIQNLQSAPDVVFKSLPIALQQKVRDRLWMELHGKPPVPYRPAP